ncbi:beta strand repeat-containing protein [Actinoplanes sp. CA-142083]|uniref:beta strand repeat-containing protein n=1 Tax=Actinoplanes sp. CA-142083 TaxID=3239903 RepID=UPI003D8F37C5
MKQTARKALAVALGTSLAAALVAVGAQPAAAYGPTANSLGCRIYFSDAGTGTSPTTWDDTFTLTQTPATPTPGQTVTVTLVADAGAINGPAPLTAGSVPVVVTVKIAGSQTGTVTLNQANYPATAVDPYVALGKITATGTYVAGGAGTSTLTVAQVKFANSTASTYCSNAGDRDHKAAAQDTTIAQNVTVFAGSASITSVTGQTVAGYARVGNTINFSVTGFAANAGLSASLKDSTGGGTAQGSGSGATDATGAGTGTLAVPAGATAGGRTVAITDGTNTVTVPITILGAPTISITPAGGGVGTAITVTGTNWNPGSTVTVGGYKALTGAPPPPASSDPAVTATASGTGGLNAAFTVNDPATAYLGAQAGALFATAAWTASADTCVAKAGNAATGNCSLTYTLSETVTAGSLAMARGAGGSSIAFTGVTPSASPQTASGALPAINVTDNRGSTFGWSLTGAVTDFSGVPAGSIPKANLTWTPSCTAHAGATNAVTAAAGTAGVAVDGATLCSGPASATGTGGSFDAAADLSLTVPANQLAGAYSATLTVTLS